MVKVQFVSEMPLNRPPTLHRIPILPQRPQHRPCALLTLTRQHPRTKLDQVCPPGCIISGFLVCLEAESIAIEFGSVAIVVVAVEG